MAYTQTFVNGISFLSLPPVCPGFLQVPKIISLNSLSKKSLTNEKNTTEASRNISMRGFVSISSSSCLKKDLKKQTEKHGDKNKINPTIIEKYYKFFFCLKVNLFTFKF